MALDQPIRIAVCEDQAEDMNCLTDLIDGSLTAALRAHSIERFESGEALTAAFRPGLFDVVFLDMYLGGMTGLDAARVIRRADAACQIVFITFSGDFALESYQVCAAHYLIKPVSEADLSEVWARCARDGQCPARQITLVVDRKRRDIPLKDILYVEVDNKLCRVHTPEGVLTARLPIDQLTILLPEDVFCRCHRGYIVNFDQVDHVDGDFVMKNGDTVYIRRNELARIRERYFQHIAWRARGPGGGAESR